MSDMDAARAVSEEDGWETWTELTPFLRTDLFYINIHVSYGIMWYSFMLLDTDWFPHSFKMYLAFPWNRINNRADNMLSIPDPMSDCCCFFHKSTVPIVVYDSGNISQNLYCTPLCGWYAGHLRRRRPSIFAVLWLWPEAHYHLLHFSIAFGSCTLSRRWWRDEALSCLVSSKRTVFLKISLLLFTVFMWMWGCACEYIACGSQKRVAGTLGWS